MRPNVARWVKGRSIDRYSRSTTGDTPSRCSDSFCLNYTLYLEEIIQGLEALGGGEDSVEAENCTRTREKGIRRMVDFFGRVLQHAHRRTAVGHYLHVVRRLEFDLSDTRYAVLYSRTR